MILILIMLLSKVFLSKKDGTSRDRFLFVFADEFIGEHGGDFIGFLDDFGPGEVHNHFGLGIDNIIDYDFYHIELIHSLIKN